MSQQPNIGTSMMMVHHIITRGLTVAHKSSLEFAKSGFPNASAREGFVNYSRCTITSLRAHHLTEDELVFPYLRGKILKAPYDAINEEHQIIDPLIPQIEAAINKIESESQPGPALQQLADLLGKLIEVWHPHIQKEEQHFSEELLEQLIDPQDHIRLIHEFGAHSQQVAKPDYLVLPFLLYNLDPPERAQFSKALPPTVTEQLVPVTWKEKWASMKPFLLS